MPRAFYEPQPPEGSTISAPDQPTQRPLSSFSFLCVLSRFSLTWQRALACPPVSGQSVAAGRGCGGWCAIARARSASGSPQRWRSTSCGRASAARSLRSTAAGKVSRCSWAGNGRSGELAEPRAPPPHSPGPPSAPNILGAGMRVLAAGWIRGGAPSMAQASVMSRSEAASTMLRTTYRFTALSCVAAREQRSAPGAGKRLGSDAVLSL